MNERQKVAELMRLHDEALAHALAAGSPHKGSEGQVTLHLTNAFERADGAPGFQITGIEVYAYVLGPSRSHYFDTVDEALTEVRGWHSAEISEAQNG